MRVNLNQLKTETLPMKAPTLGRIVAYIGGSVNIAKVAVIGQPKLVQQKLPCRPFLPMVLTL